MGGGGVSTLAVERVSVSNQGISGTVSFNSPITVGEAGFGFTLNGGTVVFENTQASLNVNELRFHLPSVPDPITLLNTAPSMADPSQWQFYFPLEGSQIPTLNLSNDPRVRITIPDESGADLILDLSTSQSPPGKPNDWRGVWIRRAQVQIGNEEGINLTLAGEGLEIGSGGFTGTLSARLNPPIDWGVRGFQLRFESAQARFESNTLAELTLPNAQLTLPGIGDIPIQNLVARSGSPLRPVSGVMSGTHTVQLFGFPLTIQNAGFTETGFRIERASLALSEGRTVEVTNLFVDGSGNLSGSLSFTGPVNFNLIDTGAYQIQVRLDNAELSESGLRVNGQVRIPIPEALRPLKPESWPDVLEANFNDVVFSAEPRVVSGRIAFTVGTEEIAVIDASGVRVNLASALPAVGQNLQVGPFTVRLDSLSASTQNFLSVSGQATLILPAGVPITPNEIQFAFENLQLSQEGGDWRVTLGQCTNLGDEAKEKLTAQPLPKEARQYTVERQEAGTVLWYAVVSVDPFEAESQRTVGVQVIIPDATALQPPKGLKIELVSEPPAQAETPASRKLILTWDANTENDLLGYHVQRGIQQEGPFLTLTNEPLRETRYEIPLLAEEEGDLFFRLQAIDYDQNMSLPTPPVKVSLPNVQPPDPPAIVQVVVEGNLNLVIAWNLSVAPDLDGYTLERRVEGGEWKVIQPRLPKTNTRYTDSGLTGGRTYEYRITAVDTGGLKSSPRSRWGGILRDTEPPQPPPSLSVRYEPGAGGVLVVWEPSPSNDVAKYLLYRAEGEKGEFVPVSGDIPPDQTRLLDVGIALGSTYRYQIIAVDFAGNLTQPTTSRSLKLTQ